VGSSTNGPYHWGNGPKPRSSSGSSGKGSRALNLIAVGLLGAPVTIALLVAAGIAHAHGAF
jgi:hypothetical protein